LAQPGGALIPVKALPLSLHRTRNKQGVCYTMALPFTIKKYLKAKEELWKLKYFTMQKYNLSKIL
jgi:hypothetical protein